MGTIIQDVGTWGPTPEAGGSVWCPWLVLFAFTFLWPLAHPMRAQGRTSSLSRLGELSRAGLVAATLSVLRVALGEEASVERDGYRIKAGKRGRDEANWEGVDLRQVVQRWGQREGEACGLCCAGDSPLGGGEGGGRPRMGQVSS